MNASSLAIIYPHEVTGVIARAHIEELVDESECDRAIGFVSRVASDIRKSKSWGCFHINAHGNYNLCVCIESDGNVELRYQHTPTLGEVVTKGTSRNQMKRLRQTIIEHFEGTQSFDEQIRAIYETN